MSEAKKLDLNNGFQYEEMAYINALKGFNFHNLPEATKQKIYQQGMEILKNIKEIGIDLDYYVENIHRFKPLEGKYEIFILQMVGKINGVYNSEADGLVGPMTIQMIKSPFFESMKKSISWDEILNDPIGIRLRCIQQDLRELKKHKEDLISQKGKNLELELVYGKIKEKVKEIEEINQILIARLRKSNIKYSAAVNKQPDQRVSNENSSVSHSQKQPQPSKAPSTSSVESGRTLPEKGKEKPETETRKEKERELMDNSRKLIDSIFDSIKRNKSLKDSGIKDIPGRKSLNDFLKSKENEELYDFIMGKIRDKKLPFDLIEKFREIIADFVCTAKDLTVESGSISLKCDSEGNMPLGRYKIIKKGDHFEIEAKNTGKNTDSQISTGLESTNITSNIPPIILPVLPSTPELPAVPQITDKKDRKPYLSPTINDKGEITLNGKSPDSVFRDLPVPEGKTKEMEEFQNLSLVSEFFEIWMKFALEREKNEKFLIYKRESISVESISQIIMTNISDVSEGKRPLEKSTFEHLIGIMKHFENSFSMISFLNTFSITKSQEALDTVFDFSLPVHERRIRMYDLMRGGVFQNGDSSIARERLSNIIINKNIFADIKSISDNPKFAEYVYSGNIKGLEELGVSKAEAENIIKYYKDLSDKTQKEESDLNLFVWEQLAELKRMNPGMTFSLEQASEISNNYKKSYINLSVVSYARTVMINNKLSTQPHLVNIDKEVNLYFQISQGNLGFSDQELQDFSLNNKKLAWEILSLGIGGGAGLKVGGKLVKMMKLGKTGNIVATGVVGGTLAFEGYNIIHNMYTQADMSDLTLNYDNSASIMKFILFTSVIGAAGEILGGSSKILPSQKISQHIIDKTPEIIRKTLAVLVGARVIMEANHDIDWIVNYIKGNEQKIRNFSRYEYAEFIAMIIGVNYITSPLNPKTEKPSATVKPEPKPEAPIKPSDTVEKPNETTFKPSDDIITNIMEVPGLSYWIRKTPLNKYEIIEIKDGVKSLAFENSRYEIEVSQITGGQYNYSIRDRQTGEILSTYKDFKEAYSQHNLLEFVGAPVSVPEVVPANIQRIFENNTFSIEVHRFTDGRVEIKEINKNNPLDIVTFKDSELGINLELNISVIKQNEIIHFILKNKSTQQEIGTYGNIKDLKESISNFNSQP